MNKQEVETLHGVKLTEKQWDIVVAEVAGKEDWELEAQVIEEVVNNIEGYEAEHQWWDSLTK